MPATPLRAQLSDQELLRRMYARPAIRCSLPDPAATAQALALPSAGSRLGSAQPAGNSAHGLDVRAMNRSAATQYGRAHGAGPRRRGAVAVAATAAGCVATAHQARVNPQDWSCQEHPQLLLTADTG